MVMLVSKRVESFRASKKIHALTLASGKKFVAVLGWLAIAVTAWFLAKACALALSPPALPAAPAFSATATLPDMTPGQGLPPFAHFSALETNNLFNLNSHTPTVAVQSSQAQGLKAFLMGTVEAPLPEYSRAVIQYQGKQYMLRPGQSIANFVLKEIRRGTAVFEANGQTVKLVTGSSRESVPAGKADSSGGAK